MKKIATLLIVFTTIFSSAQNDNIGIIGTENWMQNWTHFMPKSLNYKSANIILSGKISENTTLEKRNTYVIMGSLYVTNNAILTIEAGTLIRGDYESTGTLIITKGAKIMAEGTETDPIIFTSGKGPFERNSGDWGGIILLGDAPINKFGGMAVLDFNLDSQYALYGGANIDSNSGVIKYVRIEFPGRKINATKELNGLSLAGVGKKTKIEFVQVSFSNDDSFECYGGQLQLSNLISYKATDDDFDFTQGVQCDIKNSIAMRYPFYSDVSTSRCLEIDSFDKVSDTDFSKKMTIVNASNMTFVNRQDNNQGLVKEAIYLKGNSILNLSNTLISGFEAAVLFDLNTDEISTHLPKLNFKTLLFNNCLENFSAKSKADVPEINNYFTTTNYSIANSQLSISQLFVEPDLKKEADYRKKSTTLSSSK